MGMIDKEKVIKGLETHIKPNSKCVGCPYPNNGLCGDQLYHDALALLKKQEAVPVIQREIAHMLFWCCGSCGVAITYGDKFCRMCGKAVKRDD